MGKEDLVSNNPLRALGLEKEGGATGRRVGLIMARAGLGKTAILVQIAMDSMLRDNNVLHVAIGEGVEKTRAWYDDILDLMNQEKKVENFQQLVDEVMKNRMIMTFKESAFSRPRLEERLNDLILQDIFKPNCLVIDGFDFEDAKREDLEDIKDLLDAMSMQAWFSAVSHRNDDRVSPTGVPAPCNEIDDLFDTVVLLKPEQEMIQLDIIRNNGETVEDTGGLALDPTTMMVKKG
ncbi:MAG: hypothetical protein DSY70_04780 [Desulfobulbus sp.]|nr:MAG: hypothetical protein DSY70_04780 [Desulfobulbus sp.]